jgi:hypothetical protein
MRDELLAMFNGGSIYSFYEDSTNAILGDAGQLFQSGPPWSNGFGINTGSDYQVNSNGNIIASNIFDTIIHEWLHYQFGLPDYDENEVWGNPGTAEYEMNNGTFSVCRLQ